MRMATDLTTVRTLIAGENGLAVVATRRAHRSVQASVVNARPPAHPPTRQPVVALGGAVKLTHLRRRPRATVVFRVGYRWASIEGPVTLIGPDDPLDGFDPARMQQLLRDVFLSTGSTHDDWPTFDLVMAEERRC